ncbi:Methylase involved in ubiquinone/menaquinone biosynthesis [Paenibacillus uliginis N3/975]|uniref:Methylase involved in ubiquinone/menaquinone biosynthesis n=1 Tax=Paenibacillus uliginis N3/975 TaxID=1313296 RepID=A0A1X7HAB9_9BACL|nr:class I SAM-dependent methyltransferase [Paenibacillus uliginis]SMF82686.1 Methylase involved in ubiquinone/menaquinone biosynthesis [Paenibacillus uliginis N3/975]
MQHHYGSLCTEVYDLSKPLGHSFGDVEYYGERLKAIQGRILEVGCGSGRVLIPLLRSGNLVDGLDNSGEMLDSCRSRCTDEGLTPLLYKDEMHNFQLEQSYGAIIIPAGSFQLLEGRETAVEALNNFYQHLAPGGRLILDLFIPTNWDTQAVSTRSWDTLSGEVITLEEKVIEVNHLEQRMVSLLKYEKWKEGRFIQSELQRFPLSWYGRYEFVLLLEKIGFGQITISADYKYGEEPTHGEQMCTFEAIKI